MFTGKQLQADYRQPIDIVSHSKRLESSFRNTNVETTVVFVERPNNFLGNFAALRYIASPSSLTITTSLCVFTARGPRTSVRHLFLGTRQFFGICFIQNSFWRLTSSGFRVTLPIVLSAFPSTSPSNSWSSRSLSSYRIQHSTWHIMGLYWVPGHVGVRGHEIADKLKRDGPVQKFIGPKPSLGFPRQKNAGCITSTW